MEQKVAELPVFDRLWVWFEKNRKLVMWGAIIAVAVGLIAGYYIYNQDQKRVEGGEALSKVLATSILSGGKEIPSAEAYLKVAGEHSGTPAAAEAVLLAGEQYYTSGRFSEAQTQFERFMREFPGNAFMPQALFGKASALEAQGKVDDAARAYKDAADRFQASGPAPQAKFAVARIAESQGKLAEARGHYEDLLRTYPNCSLRDEAALRLQGIREKMPVAPAVVQTAPPPAAPVFQPSISNLPATRPASPPAATQVQPGVSNLSAPKTPPPKS